MTSFFSHAAAKAPPTMVIGIVVKSSPHTSASEITSRLSTCR